MIQVYLISDHLDALDIERALFVRGHLVRVTSSATLTPAAWIARSSVPERKAVVASGEHVRRALRLAERLSLPFVAVDADCVQHPLWSLIGPRMLPGSEARCAAVSTHYTRTRRRGWQHVQAIDSPLIGIERGLQAIDVLPAAHVRRARAGITFLPAV